jgi:hypothetical protein
MKVNQTISILLIVTIFSICISSPIAATPKQYRSGYAAGAAYGKKIGQMDGSGEAGTNAMHTNATCRIEHPKNQDFDRGYDRGCRAAYEQTFNLSAGIPLPRVAGRG